MRDLGKLIAVLCCLAIVVPAGAHLPAPIPQVVNEVTFLRGGALAPAVVNVGPGETLVIRNMDSAPHRLQTIDHVCGTLAVGHACDSKVIPPSGATMITIRSDITFTNPYVRSRAVTLYDQTEDPPITAGRGGRMVGQLAIEKAAPLRGSHGRQFTDSDSIGLFAGGAAQTSSARTTALVEPQGAVVAPLGTVYLIDTGQNRVLGVDPRGVIGAVAGDGTAGFLAGDAVATRSPLRSPQDLALAPAGALLIADTGNHAVRIVDLTHNPPTMSTLIGNGSPGYSESGSPASMARLNSPHGISTDGTSIYIADTGNHVIRRIDLTDPSLAIRTVAGLPGCGLFAGDNGPATSACLNEPSDIAVDPDTNALVIADRSNDRIRIVDPGPDGIVAGGPGEVIWTAAGTGARGAGPDGVPANTSNLNLPTGVAVQSGTLFIGDTGSHRIRAIDAGTDGLFGGGELIRTVAGTGTPGFAASDEDVNATAARLSSPRRLAVGAAGLLVSDTGNRRIRKIDQGQKISTVAGYRCCYFRGDGGPATQAGLLSPEGIARDGDNLYLSDSGDHRIRRIDSSGVITTFSGGDAGAGPDGKAAAARFDVPDGLAWRDGALYIADAHNGRVRRVDASGTASTLADGFEFPRMIAVDSHGIVYVSDEGRVSRISPAGAVTPFTENGVGLAVDQSDNVYVLGGGRVRHISASGDVLADPVAGTSGLSGKGLALDSTNGYLYIADSSSHVVRKVDLTAGTASVFAGSVGAAGFTGDGGSATSATLRSPTHVLVAGSSVYISDHGNGRLRVVNGGTITTVAGSAQTFGDGRPAIEALLAGPYGVAEGSDGTLYFADSLGHRIRAIGPDGVLRTVAGTGVPGFADGAASEARFYLPLGIAVDAADGAIYVAEGGERVRKISPSTNSVVTVAGTGTHGFTGDGGAATSATVRSPSDVAVGSDGHLYIADAGNNRIRMIQRDADGFDGDPGEIITTIVSGVGRPKGVALDSSLNIYISEFSEYRVSKYIRSSSTLTTLHTFSGGTFSQPQPHGIAVGAGGNPDVYVALTASRDAGDGNRVWKIEQPSGASTIVAGDGFGRLAGDGGPATAASLRDPTDVTFRAAGGFYISDTASNRIRRVDSQGTISSVAGSGSAADNQEAVAAHLRQPEGIASYGGDVFIADTLNHRIRRVDLSGSITTIAGSGLTVKSGFSGDGGPATSALLNNPEGIAADSAGNVYFADTGNHVVRKIASNGIITTVAGTGSAGFLGDGGPATSARLFTPRGVWVSGNELYIADSGNNRIRKVAGGVISTVAGNGSASYSGDRGPATSASLNAPEGIVVDEQGTLLIADTGNDRVRTLRAATGTIDTLAVIPSRPEGLALVRPDGLYVAAAGSHRIYLVDTTTGALRPVAGSGFCAYEGDGDVVSDAEMCAPSSVAYSDLGLLVVADTGTGLIRWMA